MHQIVATIDRTIGSVSANMFSNLLLFSRLMTYLHCWCGCVTSSTICDIAVAPLSHIAQTLPRSFCLETINILDRTSIWSTCTPQPRVRYFSLVCSLPPPQQSARNWAFRPSKSWANVEWRNNLQGATFLTGDHTEKRAGRLLSR